jgi:tetratricopeptide (TPR) repeat protein
VGIDPFESAGPIAPKKRVRELRRNPEETASWHYRMARAKAALGSVSLALDHAQRATELAPDDPEPAALCAWLRLVKGELIPSSEDRLEDLAELTRESVAPSLLLADWHLKKGQAHGAMAALSQRQGEVGSTPEGSLLLARAHLAAGDHAEALQYWRRAVDLWGERIPPELALSLMRVGKELGEKDEVGRLYAVLSRQAGWPRLPGAASFLNGNVPLWLGVVISGIVGGFSVLLAGFVAWPFVFPVLLLFAYFPVLEWQVRRVVHLWTAVGAVLVILGAVTWLRYT